MAHPRHGIAKTYSVIVKGTVDLAAIEKAQSGVWLSEGKTAGFKVRIDRKSRDRTYLRVSVREGKDDRHLGLGLYIAKLIAEGHGGTIEADNSSRGVCFTIRLPVRKTFSAYSVTGKRLRDLILTAWILWLCRR